MASVATLPGDWVGDDTPAPSKPTMIPIPAGGHNQRSHAHTISTARTLPGAFTSDPDDEDSHPGSPAETAYASSPTLSRVERSMSSDTLLAFDGDSIELSPDHLNLITADLSPALRPKKPCTFLDLPQELRIRILGYLGLGDLMRAAQTCKSMARLALDGTLWSKIDCMGRNRYKKIGTPQLVNLVSSAGGFLRVGNFCGCLNLSSLAVHALADSCPNLVSLDLRGCLLIPSSSLARLLSSLTQLVSLDLRGLPSPTNHVLEVLGTSCGKTLKRVLVGHCRNVTGIGIKFLASNAPGITHLGLSGIAGVDDPVLAHLGRSLPNLKLLDARGCAAATSTGVSKMLENLASHHGSQGARLTHLTLSSVPHFADPGMHSIAAYCPSLEQLEIAGCRLVGDAGVTAISGLAKLRNLDLEDCGVGDAAIRALALGKTAGSLERLSLSFCDEVTDLALLALLRSAPRLRSLDLDNCHRLTDLFLNELSKLRSRTLKTPTPETGPTAQLERVDVHDCRGVSREACRMVERKGVEVRSFYSSGVLTSHAEEEEEEEGGAPAQGGARRRARRGSCAIL